MSFSFTRKTDYALVALAALADQADQADPLLSARQIAEHYDMPGPLLMNVLKQLNQADLVESHRGAGGGYQLARSADAISLADVVDAIEGPVTVTRCCEDREKADDDCETCRLHRCPITRTMKRVNETLNGVLKRLTLNDMMQGGFDIAMQVTREGSTRKTEATPLVTLKTNA